MEYSWTELRPFREKRAELLKRYVGAAWGTSEEEKRRPTMLPLIAQTANAYMQSLVASNPRVLISTHERELRAFAHKYTSAINNLLKEIHFADELRVTTLDAFFSAGYMKIYWAPGNPVEVPDPKRPEEPGVMAEDKDWAKYLRLQHSTIWIDPGKPMVERISPDDFTFDMTATKWSGTRYQCHEYDVPLDVLAEDDRVDQKVLKHLKEWNRFDGSLFKGGGARADQMNQSSGEPEDLEPMTRVADVYLPFEQKWAMMGPNGAILHMDDYEGPERGPFRMLTFDDVPDSIPGLAPGMHLMHMHDLQNSLFRKQARQAKRQKSMIAYMGDSEDAENHRREPDGGYLRINNPEALKPIDTGGPNQVNMAFGQMLGSLFNSIAGNPEAMSGRGPSAKTASQESLIHGRLASREEKMRDRIITMTSGICEDLALMLWVDENKEMRGEYTLPGLDDPIPADWSPEDREGDHFQYNVHVEPYSMQYQSPQSRSEALTTILQGVILPIMPQLQQQGGSIDMAALTEMLADLNDLPRLKELVTFNAPATPPPQPGEGPANPNTGAPRHYVRESVSGGNSPDSERTQNMQALLSDGAGVNPE